MSELKPFSQRLENMIERIPQTGCWIWMGCTSKKGYGTTSYNGKMTLAHRASYMDFIGPIQDGMYVCHHCDVKSCINPYHLYEGTHLQNTLDALSRGQITLGERNSQAKLKAENIPEIFAAGKGPADRQRMAEKFNVTVHAIRDVQRGKNWKHITDTLKTNAAIQAQKDGHGDD